MSKSKIALTINLPQATQEQLQLIANFIEQLYGIGKVKIGYEITQEEQDSFQPEEK